MHDIEGDEKYKSEIRFLFISVYVAVLYYDHAT